MLTVKTSTEEYSENILSNIENYENDELDAVEMPVNQVLQLNDVIKNMQKKFYDVNTTKHEKIQILTLLPLTWTAKDIQKYFQISTYMITLARKLQRENGPMSTPCARKGTYINITSFS